MPSRFRIAAERERPAEAETREGAEEAVGDHTAVPEQLLEFRRCLPTVARREEGFATEQCRQQRHPRVGQLIRFRRLQRCKGRRRVTRVQIGRRDALAARGQDVFEDEDCARCHRPPLYTNNKLTPAIGFTVPEDHRDRFDVMSRSVGTDPELALRTRRGTGYYKVPSLRGVWYRGMFGHSGWAASLEDWFDPRRVRDDYVPTGWRPFGTRTFAVKGHHFGLELSDDDRRALIAFLKTL